MSPHRMTGFFVKMLTNVQSHDSFHIPVICALLKFTIHTPNFTVSTVSTVGSRVCHSYGKTHRFKVTVFAGMGMVPDLANPHLSRHLWHGVTGTSQVI